ncbi:MAG: Rieske 2Fe-2S domain-containing protein [Acidobacteriia bacterium]|nr:Rieske 2Fe-2S domain-containing protein [Terriglobia bacterium]
MADSTDASLNIPGSRPAAPPPAVAKPASPPPKKTSRKPAGGEESAESENFRQRRRIVWTCVVGYLGVSFLMFLRFFFPRTLFEPSTIFKIGSPSDFAIGVDTKFQKAYRVAVVKEPERLFVIFLKCTHLGCTPDWKPAENKFKCPCHGSGYTSEGINFEGPAPRPMDRAHLEVDPEGQIVVNTGQLYSWYKGEPSHFNDAGAFIPV